MKITDTVSWHAFTYTQLYPAVLGSMLYDILHFPSKWHPINIVKWSLTIFYCIDYFNLHSNLKSDKPENANAIDILIDTVVAILFGVAYWLAYDGETALSYLFFLLITILFILYYCRSPRRIYRNLVSISYLSILAAVATIYHFCGGQLLLLIWMLALMPVIVYAIFVFHLSNFPVKTK